MPMKAPIKSYVRVAPARRTWWNFSSFALVIFQMAVGRWRWRWRGPTRTSPDIRCVLVWEPAGGQGNLTSGSPPCGALVIFKTWPLALALALARGDPDVEKNIASKQLPEWFGRDIGSTSGSGPVFLLEKFSDLAVGVGVGGGQPGRQGI